MPINTIKDPFKCIHFNKEQGQKNGKPCSLHGKCMPFYYECECNDYSTEELEFPKYYNYNYDDETYYEVNAPLHDHYSYNYQENAWYENIID